MHSESQHYLKVHSIIKGSRANGPGNRFVIWTQGCHRYCPNCYNKNLRKKTGGILYKVADLAYNALDGNFDGVTISGGEPFDQPQVLYELLQLLNGQIEKLPRGIICFTGYTIEELQENRVAQPCLDLIDLIVEGRYIDDLRQVSCLAGSSNQRFVYLDKPRRGKEMVPTVIADKEVEVHAQQDSPYFVVTGFPFFDLDKLKAAGIEVVDE